MAILNYTTKVSVEKTVAEIQSILGRKGASHVSVDYSGGKVTALTFGLKVNGFGLSFRLPCNVDGVEASLRKDGRNAAASSYEQCERISWRIIKDWVEAQLALVESQQAELAEVFMPYAIYAGNTTLFQAVKLGQLLLEPPAYESLQKPSMMLGSGDRQ